MHHDNGVIIIMINLSIHQINLKFIYNNIYICVNVLMGCCCFQLFSPRFKTNKIRFVSVPLQIFVSLSSGSSLLTVPESVKSVPSRLAKALRSVTVLQATPTLIRRFGREELRCGLLGPDSKLRGLHSEEKAVPVITHWRRGRIAR